MSDALVINEIYLSLQGESSWAGLPCVFVRLTACNLRCSYCDTAYAFKEGKRMALELVRAEVDRLANAYRAGGASLKDQATGEGADPAKVKLPLVELTGGEPLLQAGAIPLMTALCEDGYTVLLETSGAHDIAKVDARVRRIMDLKCPSSGECDRNLWSNLAHLKPTDEIKFVVGTVEDYDWMKRVLRERRLDAICPILLSWVQPLTAEQKDSSLKKVPAEHTPLSRTELAERVVRDALPVRFQVQLHKVLWPAQQRGV